MFRIILFSLFLVLLTACNGGGGGGSEDDTTPTPIADLDNDGIADDVDPDIDGDTYLNADDEFPRDASEWWDTDLDLIGDNTDPDIDGDNSANDVDTDIDGDNVVNSQDDFPTNPHEWLDTDSDGIGDNADPDIDNDGILNADDTDNTGPLVAIAITSPESLLTVGVSPVQITGTIDPSSAVVVVNGQEISNTDGIFSAQVSLDEGHNTIEARATLGIKVVTDIISVSLDATPPYVTIESHEAGDTVYESEITITGLINDIVRGTIEEDQASVTVNGVEATISNRSYSANINLDQGANQITVTGSDQVGNTNSESISIDYSLPVGRSLSVLSGKNQSAKINETLSDPLQIKVLDQDENPVEGETVVFRVIQGSGSVGAGLDNEGRAIVAETDADGIATTSFKLGTRVGTANHKVRAAVVGYENQVVINATATGGIGEKISVNSGNNQRGSIEQLLPEAFIVAVTDAGANVVEGARVEFAVIVGDGTFTNGNQAYETQTDSDGRATTEFILGSLTGIDAQRVTATLLDGPDGVVVAAGFTATAFRPKAAGDTKITGVILDNQDNPIPGVTVRIEDSIRQDITDDQGQFIITEAPIGPVHLIADGSTATIEGEFPSLSYNIVTVSGVDNPLSAPVYMVKINTENSVLAGTEDVALELDKFPGFKLVIAKGSVTFPDGSNEGLVSVTPVNASKVPMAPPNGMQPQFIVTIQPTGTKFDPPARLTLPNVDAHPIGAQVEMYSYDHDLEEFVSIGLGTVSDDGTSIRSNSGVGVIKAGWHCGSQPAGQGCCGGSNNNNQGCPTCNKRQGENCTAGSCEPDDSQDPGKDCKKCSGGAIVNDDSKAPTGDDAPCKKCSGGSAVADSSKNNSTCSTDTKKACYKCKDGKCGNHCEANPDKDTKTLKTGDLSGLNSVVEKIKFAKFPPFEVSDVGASISLSGTIETGEKCCADCSEGSPEKATYTKYSGDYKLEAFIKIGFVGTSGGDFEWAGWTDYRIGVSYELGPFVTVKGSLGNSISYTESDCEEGDCLTVGVNGGLGAQLDVGGSIRVGYDKWSYKECSGSRQAAELENHRSSCFVDFKGVKAELWATGGSTITAAIAVSDCPAENKCELILGKTTGKVFYKATIDLGFFTWDKEDVLIEGTFAEGGNFSCL